MLVTVFNGDMTELKPCSPARARLLMKQEKAKVILSDPFTLRLNYIIKRSKTNGQVSSH